MKKELVIVLFLSFFTESFGQIKLSAPAPKQKKEIAFDDSKNWQGANYKSYVGQSLYVFPEQVNRNYVRERFYEKPVAYRYYKPLGNKILKVFGTAKGENSVYLKMTLDTDTIYFKYDTDYDYNFPFVVMSYYERLQKDYIGKRFVMKARLSKTTTDYVTGKEVTYIPGSVWDCIDVVIDTTNSKLQILFTNDKGETIGEDDATFISEEYKKTLEKTYGKKMVQEAIGGSIKIGMSKELVILSWGEPNYINYSSYGEQWVYGVYGYTSQYVYFENNKVTGWN